VDLSLVKLLQESDAATLTSAPPSHPEVRSYLGRLIWILSKVPSLEQIIGSLPFAVDGLQRQFMEAVMGLSDARLRRLLLTAPWRATGKEQYERKLSWLELALISCPAAFVKQFLRAPEFHPISLLLCHGDGVSPLRIVLDGSHVFEAQDLKKLRKVIIKLVMVEKLNLKKAMSEYFCSSKDRQTYMGEPDSRLLSSAAEQGEEALFHTLLEIGFDPREGRVPSSQCLRAAIDGYNISNKRECLNLARSFQLLFLIGIFRATQCFELCRHIPDH
jgi:hypothetical protein